MPSSVCARQIGARRNWARRPNSRAGVCSLLSIHSAILRPIFVRLLDCGERSLRNSSNGELRLDESRWWWWRQRRRRRRWLAQDKFDGISINRGPFKWRQNCHLEVSWKLIPHRETRRWLLERIAPLIDKCSQPFLAKFVSLALLFYRSKTLSINYSWYIHTYVQSSK